MDAKIEVSEKPKEICFTWCPSPAYQIGDAKCQFIETFKLIRKLRLCTATCKVFPELTLQGNIHYHGLFTLSDPIKWYKSVLPTFKRNGFVKVVYCVDKHRDKWVKYIMKERNNMLNILEIDEDSLSLDGLNLHLKHNVPVGDILAVGKSIFELINDDAHIENSNSTYHLTIDV